MCAHTFQAQYGKEVLKGLKDKAAEAYKTLDKEHKTVEREIKAAELAISTQSPSREEYEAEWAAVQVGDVCIEPGLP